jgi:photosystem II stability/assembly factor-like uncharacterized protein
MAAGTGSARPVANVSPNSISFWDSRHGILGTGPEWCVQCGVGTIQTSDDGGRTWKVRYRTRARITAVETSGSSDAWALLQRCSSDPARCVPAGILRSHDRGRSWSSLPNAGLVRISFGTARIGLAIRGTEGGCCIDGLAMRTQDGGRSWKRLRGPCRAARSWGGLQDLVLASRTHGWALCVSQPAAGIQGKAVFETRDSGRHWQKRAWASPFGGERGGLGIGGYPLGIAFLADGRGLLWEGRGSLAATTNGGGTWKGAGLGQPEVDFGQSASIVTRQTSFVLLRTDGHPRLAVTTDGGRRWRTVHRWAR